MSSQQLKCETCTAYNWDCNATFLDNCTTCNGSCIGHHIGHLSKRDYHLRGAETRPGATKRPKTVSTSTQTGTTTRTTQPEADPTVLFVMMKKFKEDAALWEEMFHASERDNQAQRKLLGDQQETIDRLINEVRVTRAVNDVLWERNEHQHAILTQIGQQHGEVAREYMPWVYADTPPVSPREPTLIDLTGEEDD